MENTPNCNNSSVSYKLFQYREELARSHQRPMRLVKRKYNLTKELIERICSDMHHCSYEDLDVISQQMSFKDDLLFQIQRIGTLKNLGIKNAYPDMPSTEL